MILDELAQTAAKRVAEDKKNISLDEMKQKAYALPKGDFRFEKVLSHRSGRVICEVKKASPSKGIISQDFPYLDIAAEYEKIGADCISCLTEPSRFLGSDKIFTDIRHRVNIPMLRKDFTVDEYQIYQSKVMGADAVLLICSILNSEQLKEYIGICDTLGISALVEAHNQDEIKTAVKAGARIIGVNNRNLKDFSIDLENAVSLRRMIPRNLIFIAESGIASPEDAAKMLNYGANAVLVGEAFMKSDDKSGFLKRIRELTYDDD